jgi:hypothetical protein
MYRDGQYWSVWAFRVKPGGEIETEKVLDKELYDLARLKVGKETIEAQLRSIS